jgi:hypothetical protein
MIRFLGILALTLMLPACSVDSVVGGILNQSRDDLPGMKFGSGASPRPFQMRNLPGGEDSYSVGFRDGCETTTGIAGVGLNRTHELAYDIDRGLKDREYYAGYRAGHVYCLFYTDYDPL